MKTRTIKNTVSALLAATALMLGTARGYATPTPVGIGLNTGISGNGLRPYYGIALSYTGLNWEHELGADFQLHEFHSSGVKAVVRYYPMKSNYSNLRLGFFLNAQYNYDGAISKGVTEQEKFLQPEARVNIEQLRLKTAEAGTGFMVRAYHGQHFSTFYAIGIGVYKTLENKDNYMLVHREMTHSQLILNAGLTFHPGRNR